jgi:hypothetical protein
MEALLGDGNGSFVDAYWRGRLPWMGIIEALVVTGATGAAIAGTITIVAKGGWVRRVFALPLLLVIGLWWFLAIAMSTMRAVPCDTCPPPNPDPWAFAYSVPVTALLFLIGPSLLLVLLALVRTRSAISVEADPPSQ